MRVALVIGIGIFFVACSGASETQLQGPSPTDGGSTMSTTDGHVDPRTCDASRCNLVIPDGFTLMTAADGAGACPSGFEKRTLITDPVATQGACTCACNVTQKPDCTKGNIARGLDYQNQPSCSTPGTTLPANGSCTPLWQAISTQGWHYSASLEPSGGACTFDAKVDDSKVASQPLALCEAPANCPGAACGANACIGKAGDVACPASFPNKRIAGTKANVACSTCGACTLDAKCDGTLSMFTDQNCTYGQTDFPVDGSCNANQYVRTFYSYAFQGSLKKADCSAAPPSTATASLDQPTTVCCQQK